jgi:hypothetical protein
MKKKRGRPTIMTEKVIDQLEEAFGWGCTDVEACLWANISFKTLYKYQELNPEFAQRKADLKETPVLLARKSVVSHMPRDPRLAMDYLSRKKKDEFSIRNELTGRDGKDLPTPLLGGVSKNTTPDANDDIKDANETN